MKWTFVVLSWLMFGALALGQLTGSWTVGVTLEPLSCVGDLLDLSTKFGIVFETCGVKLGMTSVFDDEVGFSSLVFSAKGTIGFVNVSSSMSFLPADLVSIQVSYTNPQTFSGTAKFDTTSVTVPAYKTFSSVTETKSYEPAFDEWQVDLSFEFAGLTTGLFFYLEGNDDGYKTNDIWVWDGTTLVQTVSMPVVNPNCLTTKGAGWKLTFSTTFNGCSLVSYTYFNLSEYDAYWSVDPRYGLNLGKRGIYAIASEGCGAGFSEEYLWLKGLSLCCGVTLDAALKMTCSGFSYLRFLVKNLPFPCCGIVMDLGVSFGLTSKSVLTAFRIADITGCVGVDLDVVSSDSTITDLRVKSVEVSCSFGDCLSFSAKTALYRDTAGLFSLKTINECDEYHFFIPAVCFDKTEAVEAQNGQGLYTEVDVPKYKWLAWERYIITACGAGCCGGQWKLTVGTYFGSRYILDSWGYKYMDAEKDVLTYIWKRTATSTEPTISTPTTTNSVNTGSVYVLDPNAPKTLFNWMATEASLSLPLTSNLSLNVGTLVSVLGFQSFTLGFSMTF